MRKYAFRIPDSGIEKFIEIYKDIRPGVYFWPPNSSLYNVYYFTEEEFTFLKLSTGIYDEIILPSDECN